MNAIDNMSLELFWLIVIGIVFCVYVVRER